MSMRSKHGNTHQLAATFLVAMVALDSVNCYRAGYRRTMLNGFLHERETDVCPNHTFVEHWRGQLGESRWHNSHIWALSSIPFTYPGNCAIFHPGVCRVHRSVKMPGLVRRRGWKPIVEKTMAEDGVWVEHQADICRYGSALSPGGLKGNQQAPPFFWSGESRSPSFLFLFSSSFVFFLGGHPFAICF